MTARQQLAALRRDLAEELRDRKKAIKGTHRENVRRAQQREQLPENERWRRNPLSTSSQFVAYLQRKKVVAADQARAQQAATERL